MANLEELLKKVSEIVVREKTQQEEKRRRGENFNIFKVLGLSTSEVRLHSAFLAELLNPNGDHGLEGRFLELFVENVVSIDGSFLFDIVSAKVYVELDIGPIRNNETEGGRIDIYIQDKNKQTIVIENKIYAGDQFKQLLRYYNYVTKTEHLDYNKNQFRLLYLTLDKHSPSPESTGGNNEVERSIRCINYKDNILTWLEKCIGLSALYPAIRETISQYVTNLKQLLNIMSDNSNKAFFDVLLDKTNIEATLSIYALASEIGVTIRENFINNRLSKLAEKNNMIYSFDKDFPNLPSGEKRTYNGINFKIPLYPNVYFKIEQWSNEVYYGIVVDNIEDKYKTVIGQFDDWNNGTPSGTWPYGSKSFPGNLKWWDGTDSLCDMVKGEKIVQIVDEELKKVLENHLIEKMNEIICKNKNS